MFDRQIARGGAVALVALLAAGPLAAQEHQWRVQGFLPDSFEINTRFRDFAADLAEKSGGEIEIEFLPVGAVVGPTETLDAMASGVLTGHFTGASYFSAKDAGFAVIGDTMGAYNSSDDQARWWDEGGGRELMRELYAQHGAHVIGVFVSPAEVIPSTVPIRSVDDFDGLPIRAVQGTVSDLFTRMGAGVVVLPGTEVFNALQTGIVDAADWAWYALNDATGLYDIVDYSVDAGHSMGIMEFSVSQRAWDALSDAQKDLVTTEWAAFSQQLFDEFQAGEEAVREGLAERGVEVIDWSEDERARLREVTYDVWDEVATRSPMAEKLVESHKAFIAELYGE
jgi:TRAP-type C4-dicarboxylate transport system substrate-binding protein